MTFKHLSVKRLFGWIVAGLFLSMSVITLSLFFITKQTAVLLTGGVLLLCALIWLFLLTQIFGKRLSAFTSVLCQTLDHMIEGNEAPLRPEDSVTMLARICYRLSRLYQIMQENRRKVDVYPFPEDFRHFKYLPVRARVWYDDQIIKYVLSLNGLTESLRKKSVVDHLKTIGVFELSRPALSIVAAAASSEP